MKTLQSFLNLASANFACSARFVQAPQFARLWQDYISNYSQFTDEYTRNLMAEPMQNYTLMNELLQTLAQRTEENASHVAHASIRSIAIATQARKQTGDRRVLRVALPEERRVQEIADRRRVALL